jgi:hypothetical protein
MAFFLAKYFISELPKWILTTFLFLTICTIVQSQSDTTIVHTFGGTHTEEGRQIIKCADGGYAILGSSGSDEINNTSFYILRLDVELNCLWNKVLGGTGVDLGFSLVEDVAGNFILCGYTNSFGEGGYDVLVYKLDPNGEIIWQRTYGGSDWDFGYKVIEHPESGFLLCGKTYSEGNGGSDGLLIHFDDNGEVIHKWTYGGLGNDGFQDIELVDDAWVICGSYSEDNLVKGCTWKMASNGEVIWVLKTSDEINNYEATSIESDGSYLYLTGNRTDGESTYGYTQRLNMLGGQLMLDAHSESNSFYFYDSQVFDGNWNIIGSTKAIGFGGFDCIVWRYTVDYGFLGGFFYGTSVDDKFSSMLIDETGMMFTGALQNSSGTWQLLAMLYTKSVLESENNMAAEEQECFTVGVENIESSRLDNLTPCSFYDLCGRLILQNTSLMEVESKQLLTSGIYIRSYENSKLSQKVFIH